MKKITFEEAIDNYLKYAKLKLKNSTYEINERKIKKYILNYFKNKNIYDLSTKDYLEWQISINNLNFSYNYKSSLHYCFTDFLNYCILFYDLSNNIAKKIGNFRNDEIKSQGNIWTLEEFNRFINVVDNPIYHTLFNFLYFTGLRKGECLALTFEDIDFQNHTIRVNKTITRYYSNGKRIVTPPKTKSSNRVLCIDDSLIIEIKKLKNFYINKYDNFNNKFYIFGGNKSIPWTTLKREKDKYCKIANVKQIKIHEFRHSHACLLFQNNIPIEDISRRLGHSSLSMTMDTYLKYLPGNEKRVISTLNSLRLI